MTNEPGGLDGLIRRLRERAADPERRTAVRPSEFSARMRTTGPGGLLSAGRGIARDLGRVVQANRQGRLDPDGVKRADDIERQLTTPVESPEPRTADDASIEAAEHRLGVELPAALRRVYAEIGDGGFGPGEGLLPLARVVAAYAELREPGAMPRGRSWPVGLLPVVAKEPGWDCVDASSGRVVSWDPDGLGERCSEKSFRSSFRELFPSVEAWLDDWLGTRTAAEEHADLIARLMSPESLVQQARAARETIARMTPEERARMGLPAVGWERVVWGGLGWDENEQEPANEG